MATTTTPLILLESGDRLTRAEFHRRYCARPDIKKAELVKGIVYVASPVRLGMHGEPHGWISSVFPGLRLAVAKTLAGDLAGVFAALDAPPAAGEG
jgi:hypothetical protein